MPGVFAGVGSIHGTVLGTEAAPPSGDKSAFISVHSDSDHMLPASGGRGFMTIPLAKVADSKPAMQVKVAAQFNGLNPDEHTVSRYNNVRVSDYSKANSPPVKEYFIEGGWRGGVVCGLLGRGRDGFPALHAVDGIGAGGWPVVGDKNASLDTTKLVVDQLLKYKRQ